jgi:23S rRNA (uracil1939-C5)-methyltransferase
LSARRRQNRLLLLDTEAELASGGAAIARAPDGRIVFVEGAAPNERVEAELLRDNARFLRARTLRVIVPGPDRVAPRCAHFGVCGGCALQHLSADAQLAGKQAALRTSLARIGRLDVARVAFDPPWSGPPYGYRSRARFAVEEGRVGFRRREARQVVDVESCPVLTPALDAALVELRRRVRAGASEARADEVEAVSAGEAFVLGSGELEADDRFGRQLLAPGVFAQSNALGNQAMIEHAVELARALAPRRILELYAGSGNFTRALAELAPVVAVEESPAAVALARRVLPANVELIEAAVERALPREERAELVVVDPPRTGLSAPLPRLLAEGGPQAILYVSCDPPSFARDAGRLAELGFALGRVRLFDLYPETPHAEVIGLFSQNGLAPPMTGDERALASPIAGKRG